jgi:hypothetical protein
VRRSGVGPCVAKRTEARAALGDSRQCVEQIARRSREAVKARHEQHVARAKLREGAVKLRAVGALAVSRKIFSASASRNCFVCAALLWPSAETRA